MWLSCIFFFQAEDGIRDLVRSRGLRDVYKRQVTGFPSMEIILSKILIPAFSAGLFLSTADTRTVSVSYTHLTLPTSDLV